MPRRSHISVTDAISVSGSLRSSAHTSRTGNLRPASGTYMPPEALVALIQRSIPGEITRLSSQHQPEFDHVAPTRTSLRLLTSGLGARDGTGREQTATGRERQRNREVPVDHPDRLG